MKSLRGIAFNFLCAVFAVAMGCGDDDDDAGGDAGADTDTDTDTDADTDTDTDADTDADAGTSALEIVGSYVDDWGGSHEITAEAWTSEYAGAGDAGTTTSIAHVAAYDNDAEYLVAQNDSALSYNPDLWARYDWMYSGDALYYCQIEYAAADEATASANEGADRADIAGGCGGFGWTLLTPQ